MIIKAGQYKSRYKFDPKISYNKKRNLEKPPTVDGQFAKIGWRSKVWLGRPDVVIVKLRFQILSYQFFYLILDICLCIWKVVLYPRSKNSNETKYDKKQKVEPIDKF